MNPIRLTALVVLSCGLFASSATGNDDDYYERVRRGNALVQAELEHRRAVEIEQAKMEVLAAIKQLGAERTYVTNNLSSASVANNFIRNMNRNSNRNSQDMVNE